MPAPVAFDDMPGLIDGARVAPLFVLIMIEPAFRDDLKRKFAV